MSNKLYQAINELSIYKWNKDKTIVDIKMKIPKNKTFIGSPKYTTKTPDGKQIIYLFPLSYVHGEIDRTNPTYAAGISNICGGPTNANLYDRCWVEYDPKDVIVVDTKFLTKQDFPHLFDKEIYMPPEDLLALAEMSAIDEGRHDQIRAARAKLAAHALMPLGPGNSTAQPQPARAAPSWKDPPPPPGWGIDKSKKSGETYYRNLLTGEVTWTLPTEPARPLPPNWEIHPSKTHGEAYYRNRLTGEITWILPNERQRRQRSQQVGLPSGWEAHADRTSGKIYYRNLFSNKSQWERPYLVAPFERQSGSIVHPPSVHAYEQRRGKHSPRADDEISPTASEIAEFEMHMENLELPSEYTLLPVPDNVMETQQLSELAELDKQEGEMRARTWAGGKSRIKSTHKKSLKKKRKSYKKSNKFRRSKRSKKLRRKFKLN